MSSVLFGASLDVSVAEGRVELVTLLVFEAGGDGGEGGGVPADVLEAVVLLDVPCPELVGRLLDELGSELVVVTVAEGPGPLASLGAQAAGAVAAASTNRSRDEG